eukprot:IDg8427t1
MIAPNLLYTALLLLLPLPSSFLDTGLPALLCAASSASARVCALAGKQAQHCRRRARQHRRSAAGTLAMCYFVRVLMQYSPGTVLVQLWYSAGCPRIKTM